MKMEYELLIEFNNNLKIVEESKKILEDKTLLIELKNIKTRFDKEKVKYDEIKSQIEICTKTCDDIAEEIENIEEELAHKEKILLNDCGSNIHKINNTEIMINKLKDGINKKSKELDIKFDEDNVLKKDIMKVSQELRILKNTFLKNKEEIHENIKLAKENHEKGNKILKSIKKEIPEELLEVYFDVKKIRKDPIAFVIKDICMGCKLGISSMKVDEVRKGNKLVFCDNCKRIIFTEK